jgi:UDP-galactopyranose mutase
MLVSRNSNWGYTKVVEKLLDGIEVRLNTDYLKNKVEFDKIADKVVFTGQIDAYFEYKLGRLEYRSVRFENTYLIFQISKVMQL